MQTEGFSKKVNFLSRKGDDFLIVGREDGSVCFWHVPSASLVKIYDASGQIISMVVRGSFPSSFQTFAAKQLTDVNALFIVPVR
jgi:WD40 repeat protein